MSRQVLYVCHAVRPTEEEIAAMPQFDMERAYGEYEADGRVPVPLHELVRRATRANLDRAMAWLAWLRRSFPETTFIAPWIASILAGEDDVDPSQPEAGLRDDCAVVERCDGIVLVGPRISEGMERETRWGTHRIVHSEWARSLAPTLGEVPEFQVYDLVHPSGVGPSPDHLWSGTDSYRCPKPWTEWGRCFLR